MQRNVLGVASTTTAAADASVITVDTSGGNRTISLPALSGVVGRQYTFINTGTNDMVIDPNGSEKIVNTSTTTLTRDVKGSVVTIIATSGFWAVVSDFVP